VVIHSDFIRFSNPNKIFSFHQNLSKFQRMAPRLAFPAKAQFIKIIEPSY
jgi:hypothetical protein